MTHSDFVAAYHAGRLRVTFDRAGADNTPVGEIAAAAAAAARRRGSARADRLALGGFAVIALRIVVPRLIKRSAPLFLLTPVLVDAAVYVEVCRSDVMRIEAQGPPLAR